MTLGARCKLEIRSMRNLTDKMSAAARKALMKQGAYIRTVAKRSITTKDRPSLPGHAPRSVTGLLREFLIFKYNPSAASVVVGPAFMGGRVFLERVETERWTGPRGGKHVRYKRIYARRAARPTVPEILETGGTSPAWVRKGKTWKNQPVTIAPRPYMAPALKRSQEKLNEFWANSLIA